MARLGMDSMAPTKGHPDSACASLGLAMLGLLVLRREPSPAEAAPPPPYGCGQEGCRQGRRRARGQSRKATAAAGCETFNVALIIQMKRWAITISTRLAQRQSCGESLLTTRRPLSQLCESMVVSVRLPTLAARLS